MLEYISDFLDENGYPPTVRDIQNGCGISSTSVVDYNLNSLREKGFLRRHADVSRGLELLNRKQPQPESVAVPILGLIAQHGRRLSRVGGSGMGASPGHAVYLVDGTLTYVLSFLPSEAP